MCCVCLWWGVLGFWCDGLLCSWVWILCVLVVCWLFVLLLWWCVFWWVVCVFVLVWCECVVLVFVFWLRGIGCVNLGWDCCWCVGWGYWLFLLVGLGCVLFVWLFWVVESFFVWIWLDLVVLGWIVCILWWLCCWSGLVGVCFLVFWWFVVCVGLLCELGYMDILWLCWVWIVGCNCVWLVWFDFVLVCVDSGWNFCLGWIGWDWWICWLLFDWCVFVWVGLVRSGLCGGYLWWVWNLWFVWLCVSCEWWCVGSLYFVWFVLKKF